MATCCRNSIDDGVHSSSYQVMAHFDADQELLEEDNSDIEESNGPTGTEITRGFGAVRILHRSGTN